MLLFLSFDGQLTAAWRQDHTAELIPSATEIKRRLEEKRRQRSASVDVIAPESPSIRINIIGAGLFQTVPPLAELLANTLPPINAAELLPTPVVRQFENIAEQLQPFTTTAPDAVASMLAERFAQLNAATTEVLANGLTPLIDQLRTAAKPYLADLAGKLAHLAQAKLDQTPTRGDLQAQVSEVVGELPRYWTLGDVARDWRLNHLPRITIREAVEMLTVLGEVRSVLVQDAEGVIPAFTQVKPSDEVRSDEIRL